MQVMPFLGESLTKKLHPERHWDPLDLYDPAINVELGVAELASLHKRFEGTGVSPRTPLVIAGYNGGEKAVRRWLGLYDAPPPADVFAEDVGYTETRRYVRKVLATLMAYRYVYGDGPPAAP
jgi:soluble lytic murein transglycosylase